ncbi:MAG: hypothetical protein IKI40_08580 [Treponema sp.]|nr:hypothetical protein [Treponema sp.]
MKRTVALLLILFAYSQVLNAQWEPENRPVVSFQFNYGQPKMESLHNSLAEQQICRYKFHNYRIGLGYEFGGSDFVRSCFNFKLGFQNFINMDCPQGWEPLRNQIIYERDNSVYALVDYNFIVNLWGARIVVGLGGHFGGIAKVGAEFGVNESVSLQYMICDVFALSVGWEAMQQWSSIKQTQGKKKQFIQSFTAGFVYKIPEP